MSKVRIEIDIANAAADKALGAISNAANKADKELDKLKNTGKDASESLIDGFGKAGGVLNIFAGNFLANITTKALEMVLAGAKALFNFFVVDGVKAAQETEKVVNELNQSLARTGIYSKETSQELQEYANNLELLTGISGDLVLKNMAVLQSLAQLDEQGLKRATKASLDLQAALAGKGVSLESATDAVSKAANGNVTALKKMGIEIQKGRTDAETLERALAAIENRFGGSARQNIQTYGGAVSRLTETWSDLSKSIGELIVNNPVVLKVINSIGDTIRSVSGIFRDNGMDIQKYFNYAILGVVRSLEYFVKAIDIAYRAWTTPWKALIAGTLQGAEIMAMGLNKIGLVSDKNLNALAEYSAKAAKSLKDNFTGETPISGIAIEIEALGNEVRNTMDGMADGSIKAKEPVNQLGKSFKGLSDEALEAQKRLKSFIDALIKQSEDIKKLDDDRLAQRQAATEFEQQYLQNQLELQEITYYDYMERRNALDQQFYDERMMVVNSREAAELERAQSAYDQELISLNELNIAKMQIQENYAQEKFKLDAEVAKRDQKNKQDLIKLEREYGHAKLAATASVFGAIADIAALGGEKAFKIVKAFNLAEAITAGVLSVQKAAASAPPPFNIPAIVQATAASAVNVARIVATKPSYATGGVVGGFQGASMGGDNVSANVRTGEMILNAAQQRNLFEMANQRQSSMGGEFVINTNVVLDGQVVATAVSRQVANGFQLGEVR